MWNKLYPTFIVTEWVLCFHVQESHATGASGWRCLSLIMRLFIWGTRVLICLMTFPNGFTLHSKHGGGKQRAPRTPWERTLLESQWAVAHSDLLESLCKPFQPCPPNIWPIKYHIPERSKMPRMNVLYLPLASKSLVVSMKLFDVQTCNCIIKTLESLTEPRAFGQCTVLPSSSSMNKLNGKSQRLGRQIPSSAFFYREQSSIYFQVGISHLWEK